MQNDDIQSENGFLHLLKRSKMNPVKEESDDDSKGIIDFF